MMVRLASPPDKAAADNPYDTRWLRDNWIPVLRVRDIVKPQGQGTVGRTDFPALSAKVRRTVELEDYRRPLWWPKRNEKQGRALSRRGRRLLTNAK